MPTGFSLVKIESPTQETNMNAGFETCGATTCTIKVTVTDGIPSGDYKIKYTINGNSEESDTFTVAPTSVNISIPTVIVGQEEFEINTLKKFFETHIFNKFE